MEYIQYCNVLMFHNNNTFKNIVKIFNTVLQIAKLYNKCCNTKILLVIIIIINIYIALFFEITKKIKLLKNLI